MSLTHSGGGLYGTLLASRFLCWEANSFPYRVFIVDLRYGATAGRERGRLGDPSLPLL